jgi:hypothetical protein
MPCGEEPENLYHDASFNGMNIDSTKCKSHLFLRELCRRSPSYRLHAPLSDIELLLREQDGRLRRRGEIRHDEVTKQGNGDRDDAIDDKQP